MQISDKELEIMKSAAGMVTQQQLLSNLSLSDPVTMMQLNDALEEKYSWGEGAHPIEILAGLRRHMTKAYGFDWTEWDPNVLLRFTEIQFGELDPTTREKIMALSVALTTDAPWESPDAFENTCLAFCNQIPKWGIWEPLDTYEMAFGMGVLDAIRDEDYDDDVLGYMAAVLLRNGVIAVPDSLPIPDINFIMRRMIPLSERPFADECIQEWESGYRVDDESGNPDSPLDVQMARLFEIEDSYKRGNDYVPRNQNT
jgi:hypothetical protein